MKPVQDRTDLARIHLNVAVGDNKSKDGNIGYMKEFIPLKLTQDLPDMLNMILEATGKDYDII